MHVNNDIDELALDGPPPPLQWRFESSVLSTQLKYTIQ